MNFTENKVLIQANASDYSFSYKDGIGGTESQYMNYGSFWAKQKNFSIKCRNKQGRSILIEGEVNG